MSVEKPFLRIDDYSKFGELVIDWAYGKVRRPTTLEDLIALFDERGITAEIPSDWPADRSAPVPKFIDLADGCVNITIPSVAMIEKALAGIEQQGGAYLFPLEYDQAYTGDPIDGLDQQTRNLIMRARIGDYSISTCM